MGLKMGPRIMILKLLAKLRCNIETDLENADASTSESNVNPPIVQKALSEAAARSSVENVRDAVRDSQKFSKYGTILATLQQKTGGPELLEELQSAKVFSDVKRKALVRLVVAELLDYHGTHYPPESAKIALAKAIITEFPRLKDNHLKDGWEPYYDRNSKTGFLEYRLSTIRTNLSPSKKKYSKAAAIRRKQTNTHPSSSKSVSTFTTAEINQKISVMQNCNPTDQNKAKITSLLEETREYRRQWIEDSSPTISEVFTHYPRLLDYNGEMIEREFDALFSKSADNFLEKFPTFYAPRIHKYVQECKPTLYAESNIIQDENLRALVMLGTLLPVSNSVMTRKGQGKGKERKRTHDESKETPVPVKQSTFPNEDLLKIVADGTNLPNYATELRKRETTNVQPYLILMKGQDNEFFFVEGDNWFVDINQKSTPIAAFNLLYKLFYVLNLQYPDSLQNFYNFIDYYIFSMGNVKPRSIVSSLHVALSQILDDNENNSSSD